MLLHLRHGLHLLTIVLLAFGYTNAVPFYDDLFRSLTPLPQPLHYNHPIYHHRYLQPIPPQIQVPSIQVAPQPLLLSPNTAFVVEPQQQQHVQASQNIPIWQEFSNNQIVVPTFTQQQQSQQRPNSFDTDAEFVPLANQQQGRGESIGRKPFDVDVITSEVNGGLHNPGVFFQQSFPFLGQDFFNSFGGFGIGAEPQQEPWWKGPNVCIENEEDEKDDEPTKEGGAEETEEITAGVSESIDVKPPLFGTFHLSVNSCIEKPNKYVCTKIVNKNGKKKTLTMTRQCCHGYGRPRNADYVTPCEKLEIKSIEATAADMGAKEFFESAKSSGGNAGEMLAGRKNQTVFMPIDKAFEAYIEQLQAKNNVVESKSDGNLYLRHIVNGEVSLYDVNNEQMLKTLQTGQSIRINTYQLPLKLGNGEPFRHTANCVPIEKHDKLTEQGLVHTLRGVLKPVTKNLMDIIRERPDMSIMRTVLEKTKLSEMLEQNEKPVTIFVPIDDAFDKLEPNLRRALKEGKGCATNILKNHMLDLTFCSVASVAGARTTAYNLLGEAMRFNRTKLTAASSTTASPMEKSEVNDLAGGDQATTEEQLPVIINGIAKINEADIMGTNGVMHVIDTILPTQSALPISTLMQEKNVTIFKRLLESAGLNDKFDDMDNITVFAPTDKALENTKWAQILKDSPEQLRDNEELKEFLQNHVVQPKIKTCDLNDGSLLKTLAGAEARINLYSTHSLLSNVMNRATVNCARLVHFDDESCGSAVLHQVDKALTPPKINLLQALESNPNYSKFLELIRSANLTNLLTNTEGGYTLFVPKNDVFVEFEDSLAKDPAELENLLKTHIVNEVVCCAGIIPTNWPFIRTIESLNGAHLRITRERRPKVENAGITKCDSVAVNGVIHEINDVIVPARRQFRPQASTVVHDLFFK